MTRADHINSVAAKVLEILLGNYRASWQNRLDSLQMEIARGKKARVRTIGTMRTLDDAHGAVRVEDVYNSDIDNVWQACTTPERLARWIADVSGDLRVGGTVHAVFTSTWNGPARIEVCDGPHHLLLITGPETDDETLIEAWLTAEGSRTRLVVEERGLPVAQLHFYAAGWQVHLEDLGRSLVSDGSAHVGGWSEQTAAPAWHGRWTELIPTYENATAH